MTFENLLKVIALAVGLVSLGLSWIALRRRLLAERANPSTLRRFHVTFALVLIAGLSGLLWFPRGLPFPPTVNLVLLTLVFVIGSLAVLPVSKLKRPLGAFVIGILLFMIRGTVLHYAARGGPFFVVPVMVLHAGLVLVLLATAGVYFVRDFRLAKL
jgi:hypothetical protein